MTQRSLENAIRDIMASQSQNSNLDSTELEESVEEIVEEVETVEEVEAAEEEQLEEKTLTPAEKKKREEIAKAIERDNPNMPMDKKMAIATATAKKVAESLENRHKEALGQVFKHMDQVKSKVHKAKFQKRFDKHLDTYDHSFSSGGERAVKGLNDIANDIKKHNSKVSESSISDRTKKLIERAINRKS